MNLPRRNKKKRHDSKPTLELIDEAFCLVRSAPAWLSTSYLIGTVPFVLGMIYFWSDMSRSAFAERRCLEFSLALALLFFWMKIFQAVYARGLRAIAAGRMINWSLRRIARMVVTQVCLQPYGIIAIPLSMIVAFPLPAVHAFYQNLSAMEEQDHETVRAYAARAWKQAKLWPTQSGIIVWLLSPWMLGVGLIISFWIASLFISYIMPLGLYSDLVWFFIALLLVYYSVFPFAPFSCIVAANIAVAIYALPLLLKMLFGVESTFTTSGWHTICNTTYIMAVFALAYICLDPLSKAAHALRCYYGDAIKSGEDLLKDLEQEVKK